MFLCLANIFLSGRKGGCGLDPWDMQDAAVWNFGTSKHFVRCVFLRGGGPPPTRLVAMQFLADPGEQ